MSDPRTKAGRMFDADPYDIPNRQRRHDYILAIEAEAVASWLASPEAEEALLGALDRHELMTNPAECVCDEWSYLDEAQGVYFQNHQARAILRALRGKSDG
jgi:hypothetical protein